MKRIPVEELANTITHGTGLLLSIAGLAVVVTFAALRGTVWNIVACAIYGSTLVCLYTASTLYHATVSPRMKRALEVFDHCAIYMLIAGTYTPFLLVNLRGTWGWSLLGIVWGIAMAGIIFKLRYTGKYEFLSVAGYILMGWLALIAAKPMVSHISPTALSLLVAGGILYSVGVVFYAWRRFPHHHAIWHSFVVAGSVCHYFAILSSLLSPHA